MKKIVAAVAVIILLFSTVAVTLESTRSVAYAQEGSLEQRIEEYKAQLRTASNRTEEQRFRLRCNVAQTVVRNLQPRVIQVQDMRKQAYQNILDALNNLNATLDEEGVEAPRLKEQTEGLAVKITAFNIKMALYRQVVDDMIALNCTEDPIALKAALQVARDLHAELTLGIGDIRTYINNTVKPTLNQVKAQLASRQGEHDAAQ